MLTRRVTLYLIAGGILALLSVSFLGYRAYQNHVKFTEFMSETRTFQQSLDKDTRPKADATDWQTTQRRGNAASPISGLATRLTEHSDAHKADVSKKPVKVRIMPPEAVAKYSDGDPNAAVRVESEPRPSVPDRTWTGDELVSQWVELPDGEVVKILVIPGMEIWEEDRVSLQYIENLKDKRGNYIEMDGIRYDVSMEVDAEYAIKKMLWADTFDVSVAEIERMIANRELIVKRNSAPMTPEESEINANIVRLKRPDLYEAASPLNQSHRFSDPESWEIEPGEADTWVNDPLFEPIQKGTGDSQSTIPSEPPTVSNQETEAREGLSPERFDKARQLIDQYGSEEGLRRLREMDPEAARQFERERKTPPARDESETQ